MFLNEKYEVLSVNQRGLVERSTSRDLIVIVAAGLFAPLQSRVFRVRTSERSKRVSLSIVGSA